MALILIMLATLPLALSASQSGLVQVTEELRLGSASPEASSKVKPTPTSVDYKLSINKGKTAIPVTLVVYTENDDGLQSDFVMSAITSAAASWDAATSAALVSSVVKGTGTPSVALNGENSVFFGDYSEAGVIAVASYWYNRATRQIVECDIIFDTDFQWGDATADATLMDLQNIATHELGHFFNLADIYDASKSYLTMYGYSSEGDIEKRTLEAGDIAGIQKVFGV
jgi:hypothetical protein